MIKISLILFFTMFCLTILSQVQRETRAVWVTTNFSLDWPPSTLNVEDQKAELRKIFENIKEKNLNTVYFQVRSNGTVLYKSETEPFSPYITGNSDDTPPYDPLQFAIDLGKEFNLEVHAWLNMIRCFSGSDNKLMSSKKHIKNKRPEWIIKFSENGSTSYWLNPGLPEVQDYLVNLMVEISSKYDIDGLHLDFFRYPGKSFNDDYAFKKYSNDTNKDEWRRNNLTEILRKFSKVSNPLNKFLKLGVTPVGIHKSLPNASGWEGYSNVYQDTEKWLSEGLVDYLTPQIYWGFDGNPHFDILANDWVTKSYNRNIILGLAAYKLDIKFDLKKMIDYSRKISASGIALFRYRNLLENDDILFNNIAFPSEMSWKEIKNEYSPLPIECDFENISNNEILINWKSLNNLENVHLRSYVLYENRQALRLISPNKNKLKLNFRDPSKLAYTYILGSIDKLWNEISNSSPMIIQVPFLLNLKISSKVIKKPLVINSSSDFFVLNVFSTINQNLKIEVVSKENFFTELMNKVEFGSNFIKIEENLELLQTIKIIFTAENRVEEINFY